MQGNWCTAEWCSALSSSSAVWQLVLLWALGAVIGWLLPRPKSTPSSWLNIASAFSPTSWRRVALAWHGAIIMREIWYHYCCPGTFRRLAAAVMNLAAGKGWHFDFPSASQPGAVQGTPCDPKLAEVDSGADNAWYVTAKDLEFYKRSVETTAAPTRENPAWEVLMDREIPGVVKYTAWRRYLANGKTEYKSITVSPDVTAEEFMDMYMDDDNRPNWDTMIIHNEMLESGNSAQRQQVVRWIRRFPFSFISDREYIIAKRLFREKENLYGITKSIEHPRAPANSDVVRMDVFYSMWRSKTVPCPWNSGAPACETVLLHHEQMKIPENLSRFAVKHGMWGFVRKLSSETPKFVEGRRKRCDPYQADPQAYGMGMKPNPPCLDLPSTGTKSALDMRRTDTSTSALSSLTTQSSTDTGELDAAYRYSTGGAMQRTKSGKLRGLAAFAIASGLAVLLRHSVSSEKLPGSSRGKMPRMGSSNSIKQMRRTRTQTAFSEGAITEGF